MKVQEIVRSIPWVVWRPGISKCYRDESFTRNKRKLRFKFDYIKTEEPFTLVDERAALHTQRAIEVKELLEQHGHTVESVSVFDGFVAVYQEFPIQITELAKA